LQPRIFTSFCYSLILHVLLQFPKSEAIVPFKAHEHIIGSIKVMGMYSKMHHCTLGVVEMSTACNYNVIVQKCMSTPNTIYKFEKITPKITGFRWIVQGVKID
jgi:hypothetical protein